MMPGLAGMIVGLADGAAPPPVGTAREFLVGGPSGPMYINSTADDLDYLAPVSFVNED